MNDSDIIYKAFTIGYRFDELHPGLISRTLPDNTKLSHTLTALKAGATQRSLDIEHDHLRNIERMRNTDQAHGRDIER